MTARSPRGSLSFNGPTSSTARNAGWVAAAVAIVALLVIGARPYPTDGLSDDRLYALGSQLKCLQCAGESVAGSQADIAIRMRSEISDQMRLGRSDDEILSFFADRYGQRVLLNPPNSGIASLVWILPVVAAAAGVSGLAVAFARWRRQRADAAQLVVSDADAALVDAALLEADLVDSEHASAERAKGRIDP